MSKEVGIARFIIEFTSAFHIGTGKATDETDAPVVTDVNGLPASPGSSLVGVLRAAARDEAINNIDIIFGSKAQGSKLTISWGCICKSNCEPVEGLMDPADILKDPVLVNAKNHILRDHVKLNNKGVADSRGKFDELVVCAGHRFMFELIYEGSESEFNDVIALLKTNGLSLGGKTRRGFGSFVLRDLQSKFYNLDNDNIEEYAEVPHRLKVDWKGASWINEDRKVAITGKVDKSVLTEEIALTPDSNCHWYFGKGIDIEGENSAHPADSAPVREDRIIWNENLGSVQEYCFLIPGSAVKGALRHRVAFHFNALIENFIDAPKPGFSFDTDANLAVIALFGSTADKDIGGSKTIAGNVYIDDFYIPTATSQNINHVSIDRFTGGARSGPLFNERALYGVGFKVKIRYKKQKAETLREIFEEMLKEELTKDQSFIVKIEREIKMTLSSAVMTALKYSLDDLVEGRLQMGAGSGKGHGHFKVEGKKPEKWFPDREPSENTGGKVSEKLAKTSTENILSKDGTLAAVRKFMEGHDDAEGWFLVTRDPNVLMLPGNEFKDDDWIEGAEICAGEKSLHVRPAGANLWSVVEIEKKIAEESDPGELKTKTFKGKDQDLLYEVYWGPISSSDGVKELRPLLYRFAGFNGGK